MSAIVIGSFKACFGIVQILENIGVNNIHFYNLQKGDSFDPPISALVPFIDLVVIGENAGPSLHLNKVIKEAIDRHIPIMSEKCLA